MLWHSSAVALIMLVYVTHLYAQKNAACTTVNSEAGKCVPLSACTNLLPIILRADQTKTQISDEDLSILRRSHCGSYDGAHHVCCGNSQIQLNARGLELLQAATTCGQFEIPKIAHGTQADLYAFPWMALLKYNNGKTFRCGGSLITERYVLTAAHCIVGFEDSLTEVRLGEHTISSATDCVRRGKQQECAPPVEDIGIERLIPHEDYRRNQIYHDIALLRLNRKVNTNQRHIKTICLPLTEPLRQKIPNDYIVSGWGNTENDTSADVLMYTTVPQRTLSDCAAAFQLKGLAAGHICAGGANLEDSCKGDSGGPLTQIDLFERKLRLVQFGVVSLGISSCGQRNYPGIYANVSHYLPWISENIVA